MWIDVRTAGEYAQGHLEGAHHIPFDAIQAGVKGLGLEEDAQIYLYCSVGGRAEHARDQLLAIGYRNVVNAGSLENAREMTGGR